MNQFSKSEKELVDSIIQEIKVFGHPECSFHGLAHIGVLRYAEPCDQEAAAQAVIELVKKKLNAH